MLENKYESCLFSFAVFHQQAAIGTQLQVFKECTHILLDKAGFKQSYKPNLC